VKKLQKIVCEICGEDNKSVLDYHHIIERTEIGSSHNMLNLAILCACCHRRSHNDIKVIGVIPSTKMPYGRTLIYEENGIRNIDLDPVPIPALNSIKIRSK
jgi:hypothetical protein